MSCHVQPWPHDAEGVLSPKASTDNQGDFRPESEALEPDADIVDLTTVLLESEEVASRTLVAEDRE